MKPYVIMKQAETARMARCEYCGKERPSAEADRLAFFQPQPNKPYDCYYCGCYGWE